MAQHGYSGIDTAHAYSEYTSEQVGTCALQQLYVRRLHNDQLVAGLELKGMRIDTKIYPIVPGDHAPSKLKETFQDSLTALKGHKIRVFYLHAPDRSIPFEDTLRAVHELYKAGHL